jgi:hypothetical protein
MRASASLIGAVCAGAAWLAAPQSAWAHAECGNRVFPATLTMDDPGVGDELSLPTVTDKPIPANNGASAGHSIDYAYEWDKTITQDLGFAVNGDYFTQRGTGQNLNGWGNLNLTLKDELPCLEAHELMASLGVAREFSKSGSAQLVTSGSIDSVSNTTPTLYLGKGMGDLPIAALRPVAITSEFAYQVSDQPNAAPNQWKYSFSVQYSLPYLNEHVKAMDLPEFLTRLVPLIEFAYSAPHNMPTTGTMAPGVLYEADLWQFGVEALIPVNNATRQSQGNGVIAQMHFFIDDIFPNSIGKPLIDRNLWQ